MVKSMRRVISFFMALVLIFVSASGSIVLAGEGEPAVTEGPGGSWMYRLDMSNTWKYATYWGAKEQIQADTEYVLSAWICGEGNLRIQPVKSGGSVDEVFAKEFSGQTTFEPGNTWEKVTIPFTSPDAEYDKLEIMLQTVGGTGYAYVADVVLKKVDGAANLVAPDFDEGWWEGWDSFAQRTQVFHNGRGMHEGLTDPEPGGGTDPGNPGEPGGYEDDGIYVHSGNYALKVAQDSNVGSDAYIVNRFALEPGEYTLSLWAKGEGTTYISMHNDWWSSGWSTDLSPDTGAYKEYSWDFTVAGEAWQWGGLYMDDRSGVSEKVLYIDDIRITNNTTEEIVKTLDFESGDFSGWNVDRNTSPVVYSMVGSSGGSGVFEGWEPPDDWTEWQLIDAKTAREQIEALNPDFINPNINNHSAYVWDRNPEGVADYEEWIGRAAYLAEDFARKGSWDEMNGISPNNNIDDWINKDTGKPDYRMLLSYPVFPDSEAPVWNAPEGQRTAAYQAAADGSYNSYYKAYGRKLIDSGMGDAIIRFGHEFNGNWYAYKTSDESAHEAYYAQAFQQFVTALRSLNEETGYEGKADFKFCWNPTLGKPAWPGVNLNNCWPGKEYVDYIGIDIYDSTYSGGIYDSTAYFTEDFQSRLRRQKAAWSEYMNQEYGLAWFNKLSAQNDVPLALCEWSCADRAEEGHLRSGLDNPYFIYKMYEWIYTSNVAWHVRFNVDASDLSSNLYRNDIFKEAAAQFQMLWNPKADEDEPEYDPEFDPYHPVAKKYSLEKMMALPELEKYQDKAVAALPSQANLLNAWKEGDPWALDDQLVLMWGEGASFEFRHCLEAQGLAFVYKGFQKDRYASIYVIKDGEVAEQRNHVLFKQNGRGSGSSYGYVVLDDLAIPEDATVSIRIDEEDWDAYPDFGWDSLQINYMLLLGAEGNYEGGADEAEPEYEHARVYEPFRTSSTYSGYKAVEAKIGVSGTNEALGTTNNPMLTSGTEYILSTWVKGTGTVALRVNDAKGWSGTKHEFLYDVNSPDEWKRIEFKFTPAATQQYQIRIGQHASGQSGNAGTVYVDCLYLVSSDGKEIVIDTDFDDNTTSWWPEGGFKIVDYSVSKHPNTKNGAWGMIVNGGEAAANTASLDQPAALMPGKEYTFKIWAKGTAGDSFEFNISDGSGVDTKSFTLNSNGWQELEYKFIIPSAGDEPAPVDYTLTLKNFSTGGYLYFDNLLLYTPDGNNLIPNCDFEMGKKGWRLGTGIDIVDYTEPVILGGAVMDDFTSGFDKMESHSNVGTESGSGLVRSSAAGDSYAVYQLNEDIQSVSIPAYIKTGNEDKEFKLYVSGDGETYGTNSLPTGKSLFSSSRSGYDLWVFECYDIPAGSRYIKIVFEETDAAVVQLDSVYINSRCMPVAATPGDKNETVGYENSVTVTLGTGQPTGTIMYSLDGGEPQQYTSPIRLTSSHTITAWTIEYGKYDSIVSTFKYFNTNALRVDKYGQIIKAEYPAKIPSGITETGLETLWEEDETWLETFERPETWDEWGGLIGSQETFDFEATGFFHVEKRWDEEAGIYRSYMVNPLGNLYFNIAANAVDDNESYTIVSGREDIYEWLPDPGDPLYAGAWNNSGAFSFYAANWTRKNGKPYDKNEFLEEGAERMKNLGFNGFGAWSNASDEYMPTYAWLPMPGDYMIQGTDLLDVFHENFGQKMDQNFASIAANKDNPNILGYLMANELAYNLIKTAVPAQTGSNSGVKKRFVKLMKEKYLDVASFNAAWGTDLVSWDSLQTTNVKVQTDNALEDMNVFTRLYLDELYRLTSECAKKYDPNHMVVGDRWLAGVMNDPQMAEMLCEAAGRYLDAMSYNYYTYELNSEKIANLYKIAGETPFIFTEFHYGDSSTGLNFAVRMAENEEEKGSMYSNYVEKAAASGMVVGINWFTYLDQAPTGRYFQGENGEAGAIGLFNVADRPYRTFLNYVTKTNYHIYDIIMGEEEPHKHVFKEGQTERETSKLIQVPYKNGGYDLNDLSAPWSAAATARIDNKDLVNGLFNSEIYADMYLVWDKDYLYFRADITEPTPMQSYAALSKAQGNNWNEETWIYAQDAIELFFGPRDAGQGGSMKIDDRQLLFGAAADGDNVHTIFGWYHPSLGNFTQPEVPVAGRLFEDGTGYSIAAKIPLKYILNEETVAAGREIRFDMGFDQADEAWGDRNRQYLWNGVESNSQSREKWGMMKLMNQQTGVEIVSLPDKTVYYIGESIDLTGLAVNALYDVGESVALNAGDYVVSGFDSTASGVKTVTVEHNGFSKTFAITVIVKNTGEDSKPVEPDNPVKPEEPKETDEPGDQPESTYPRLKDDPKEAYVTGYGDNTFRPNQNITRYEMAVVLYRLLDDTGSYDPELGGFKDVKEDRWFSKAVKRLSALGILKGYGDGTFRGHNTITRAEFVTLVSLLFPLNENTETNFTDVEGHWAYKFIVSANANGWISGYGDGTFRPNNPITRAEMAVILNKMLGRTALEGAEATGGFNDVSEDFWAYRDIMLAAGFFKFE